MPEKTRRAHAAGVFTDDGVKSVRIRAAGAVSPGLVEDGDKRTCVVCGGEIAADEFAFLDEGTGHREHRPCALTRYTCALCGGRFATAEREPITEACGSDKDFDFYFCFCSTECQTGLHAMDVVG